MSATAPRGVVNAALGALLLGVVALATIVIFSIGSSSYALHALFENSGQLVSGGEVQVAGRSVGSISSISITPNGLADITLSIDDGSITPLHGGVIYYLSPRGSSRVGNAY